MEGLENHEQSVCTNPDRVHKSEVDPLPVLDILIKEVRR